MKGRNSNPLTFFDTFFLPEGFCSKQLENDFEHISSLLKLEDENKISLKGEILSILHPDAFTYIQTVGHEKWLDFRSYTLKEYIEFEVDRQSVKLIDYIVDEVRNLRSHQQIESYCLSVQSDIGYFISELENSDDLYADIFKLNLMNVYAKVNERFGGMLNRDNHSTMQKSISAKHKIHLSKQEIAALIILFENSGFLETGNNRRRRDLCHILEGNFTSLENGKATEFKQLDSAVTKLTGTPNYKTLLLGIIERLKLPKTLSINIRQTNTTDR